jgi:hypothetical protein
MAGEHDDAVLVVEPANRATTVGLAESTRAI